MLQPQNPRDAFRGVQNLQRIQGDFRDGKFLHTDLRFKLFALFTTRLSKKLWCKGLKRKWWQRTPSTFQSTAHNRATSNTNNSINVDACLQKKIVITGERIFVDLQCESFLVPPRWWPCHFHKRWSPGPMTTLEIHQIEQRRVTVVMSCYVMFLPVVVPCSHFGKQRVACRTWRRCDYRSLRLNKNHHFFVVLTLLFLFSQTPHFCSPAGLMMYLSLQFSLLFFRFYQDLFWCIRRLGTLHQRHPHRSSPALP